MAYELPSLQKKIDEFNELFELDDEWNVRYVVDEDDYDDSILIHLYDYSETLDSDEFYGIGAYGELFPRWFERFDKAVQEDTGDSEFRFEPYSYSGHFTGRAYLKGQERWPSSFFAKVARGVAGIKPKTAIKKKADNGASRLPHVPNSVGSWEGFYDGTWCIVFENGYAAYVEESRLGASWFLFTPEGLTADSCIALFDGDYAPDNAYEAMEECEDAFADWSQRIGKSARARGGIKKKASDGWSKEKCSELILALHRCEALLYEIENSRRGYYVPIVGNTYRELSRYAERLGESIIDAAREIDSNYGWMKSDDIDSEDEEW